MKPVSYQGKVGDWFFPELLVIRNDSFKDLNNAFMETFPNVKVPYWLITD
jgi:hypothetical protein